MSWSSLIWIAVVLVLALTSQKVGAEQSCYAHAECPGGEGCCCRKPMEKGFCAGPAACPTGCYTTNWCSFSDDCKFEKYGEDCCCYAKNDTTSTSGMCMPEKICVEGGERVCKKSECEFTHDCNFANGFCCTDSGTCSPMKEGISCRNTKCLSERDCKDAGATGCCCELDADPSKGICSGTPGCPKGYSCSSEKDKPCSSVCYSNEENCCCHDKESGGNPTCKKQSGCSGQNQECIPYCEKQYECDAENDFCCCKYGSTNWGTCKPCGTSDCLKVCKGEDDICGDGNCCCYYGDVVALCLPITVCIELYPLSTCASLYPLVPPLRKNTSALVK